MARRKTLAAIDKEIQETQRSADRGEGSVRQVGGPTDGAQQAEEAERGEGAGRGACQEREDAGGRPHVPTPLMRARRG